MHEEDNRPHPNSPDKTIAEIADQHELGLGVPRRSWLRGWLAARKDKIDDILTDFHPYLPARTAQRLQASIQGWMRAGQVPGEPLKPSTIAKKGHDRKLIDSEALVKAIKAKLHKVK